MNDEIKLSKNEIIGICEFLKIHHFENSYLLLDYITNLQEENEDLKDRLKVMEHFKNSLQEENEKLKELCAKYEEEHNTAFKLWTMKMEEVPTYEEKMIYKSRCEKLREYINTHKVSDTISFPLMKKEEENQVKSCFDYEFEQIYKKELLNIVNGGDE